MINRECIILNEINKINKIEKTNTAQYHLYVQIKKKKIKLRNSSKTAPAVRSEGDVGRG